MIASPFCRPNHNSLAPYQRGPGGKKAILYQAPNPRLVHVRIHIGGRGPGAEGPHVHVGRILGEVEHGGEEGQEDVVAGQSRGAGDPFEFDADPGRGLGTRRQESWRVRRRDGCGGPWVDTVDRQDAVRGLATGNMLHRRGVQSHRLILGSWDADASRTRLVTIINDAPSTVPGSRQGRSRFWRELDLADKPVLPVKLHQGIMKSRKLDHVYGGKVDAPNEKAGFRFRVSPDLDLPVLRVAVRARLQSLLEFLKGHIAHEMEDVYESWIDRGEGSLELELNPESTVW